MAFIKHYSYLAQNAGPTIRSKALTLEDFMKGYQLEFFTQQDMFHGGKHLSDWLIERARAEGIRSATVFMGSTGFGQDRRIQAAHMFDLIDHPVQVTMIVGETECERLFALLARENLHLFYVKLPVEFGKVGE